MAIKKLLRKWALLCLTGIISMSCLLFSSSATPAFGKPAEGTFKVRNCMDETVNVKSYSTNSTGVPYDDFNLNTGDAKTLKCESIEKKCILIIGDERELAVNWGVNYYIHSTTDVTTDTFSFIGACGS